MASIANDADAVAHLVALARAVANNTPAVFGAEKLAHDGLSKMLRALRGARFYYCALTVPNGRFLAAFQSETRAAACVRDNF